MSKLVLSIGVASLGFCNVMAGVGDAVIAAEGFEGRVIHLFDGTQWQSMDLATVS